MADLQRKSYNLFDKDNADIRQCYVWNDRNYVAASHNTRSVILACKPNTTYTVSKTLSDRFALAYTNANPTLSDDTPAYGIVVDNDATSLTITTGGSAQYLVIFFIYIPAETKTVEEIVATIMVNEGSTPLPYEPYGWLHSLRKLTTATEAVENPLYSDGTAITAYTIKGNEEHTGTPTPSNPVMPNGVGERTENLSPVGSFTITAHDASQRVDIFSGTLEAGNYVVALNQDNAISGSTRNTLQVTVGGTTYYNSSSANYHNQSGQQKMTFTVAETGNVDVKYWANDLNENCSYSNITFNAGSEVINEPYGYKIPISTPQGTSNIYLSEPLYKIGDYADVINSDGTVSRRIAKLTMNGDGSVTWNKSSTYQGSFYAYNALVGGLNLWTPMVCTHATWIYPIDVSHYVYGTCGADGSPPNPNLNLFIGQADWDVTQFNQFLSENPVTVYYVLATATTEQITLPAIVTTEGANSISVDTTVQPSEFTATWTGWHNAYVKEKSENLIDSSYIFNASINALISGRYSFPYTEGGNRYTAFFAVQPNTTYTFSATGNDRLYIFGLEQEYTAEELAAFDTDELVSTDLYCGYNTDAPHTYTFTTSSTARMIGVYYSLNVIATDVMANEGQTALPYEPYWK